MDASLTVKNFQNLEGIIFFNFDDQKNIKGNLLGYKLRQTPNIQLKTSIDLDPNRFYSDQEFLQLDGETKTNLNIIFQMNQLQHLLRQILLAPHLIHLLPTYVKIQMSL